MSTGQHQHPLWQHVPGGQRGPGMVLVPSPEGLGAVLCPPLHRGGKVPACMFMLQTSAPSERGKKPL